MEGGNVEGDRREGRGMYRMIRLSAYQFLRCQCSNFTELFEYFTGTTEVVLLYCMCTKDNHYAFIFLLKSFFVQSSHDSRKHEKKMRNWHQDCEWMDLRCGTSS